MFNDDTSGSWTDTAASWAGTGAKLVGVAVGVDAIVHHKTPTGQQQPQRSSQWISGVDNTYVIGGGALALILGVYLIKRKK